MSSSYQSPQSLTVTLGFGGSLQVVFPGGKAIDLPIGDAEARMVEILEGFRRDLKSIRKERSKASVVPEALSLSDLGL